MNFQCINELEKQLAADFPHAELAADWEIEPELCPSDMNGDITINCFRFAKIFKVSPDKIAESVLSFLSVHKDVEKTEKIKVLKAIAERQHAALQKLIGNPSNGEALTVGLRKTIRQLATCNPNERSAIAAIAERMMDSMLGVQV